MYLQDNYSMDLRLKTPPTELPLTVAEYKQRLNILNDDQDTDIETALTEAVSLLERQLDRTFLPTVWTLNHTCWAGTIYLPKPPLVSVGSIKYYKDGTLNTVSSSNYFVCTPYLAQAFIAFKASYDFPSVDDRPDAIQIEFTTGSTEVSTTDKLAIKVVAGWIREDPTGQRMNFEALDRLINVLRWHSYA